MSIPRFSLYREFEQWKDDIKEDTEGRWVRWRDVEPYTTYALEHGFVPITEEPLQVPIEFMADGLPEEINDEEEILPDDGVDAYDMVTQQAKERFDDE